MRSFLCVILAGGAAACSSNSSAPPPDGTTATLRDAFAGLRFQQPLGIVQQPGDPRIFIVEKGGTVQAVSNNARTQVLDITARVNSDPGEAGLLGLAFHPQWQQNHQIFVNYTAPSSSSPANLRTTISRFSSSDGGATIDPASEQVLRTLEQPFPNHNGGSTVFGPDGFLYLGIGDGGSAGDPLGNAQNTNVLFGKLLRIDVDSGTPYGIPQTNPFASGIGGAPEVYAYGLRNPWRFSFDRATGDLWLADVGQNAWEEVDRIQAGGNYGWNRREGSHCYPPGQSTCTGPFIDPVVEYSHSEGISITGGFVYRGSAIPQLVGHYIYGDFGSGTIWSLPPTAPFNPTVIAHGANISSFGEGADGELYVADLGSGQISKIVPPP
jgi:glucose/arabinose dehydrogenase